MAVTLTKLIGRLQLDNGTDSEGNQKLVAISIGNLSEANWSDSTSPAQIAAVATALEPCLSKTVYRLETVATNTVTAD